MRLVYLYRTKRWRSRGWTHVPRQPKPNPGSYKAHRPKWRWRNTFWLGFYSSVALFFRYLHIRRNLKLNPIGLESSWDKPSNNKKIYPIWNPDAKVINVWRQVYLCSLNLSPWRGRLGLYLLLGKTWCERTFCITHNHVPLHWHHFLIKYKGSSGNRVCIHGSDVLVILLFLETKPSSAFLFETWLTKETGCTRCIFICHSFYFPQLLHMWHIYTWVIFICR